MDQCIDIIFDAIRMESQEALREAERLRQQGQFVNVIRPRIINGEINRREEDERIVLDGQNPDN